MMIFSIKKGDEIPYELDDNRKILYKHTLGGAPTTKKLDHSDFDIKELKINFLQFPLNLFVMLI